MKLDSHQHFWKYNPAKDAWITEAMHVLKRDYMPTDLEPVLVQNDINGCIAVQAAQSEEETYFLLSLAEQHDFIKGVVGWVDLLSPELEEKLVHFSTFPKLKGFRHIVQAEAPGFMLNRKFIEGVNLLSNYNFTYDLLVYHYQLDEVLRFLPKVDSVKIVVDHIAKPSIGTKEITTWSSAMHTIASFKNTYCKISGMVTETNWQTWGKEDFFPYLDKVFEAFGTDRLLYGSDWPVCLLSASYEQQLAIVQEYITGFSSPVKDDIMGLNAKRFYSIK